MIKGSPNPHKGTYPRLLIVTQRVVDICKEPTALYTKSKILNSEHLKPNMLL
jgi:hypothetical protein